MKKFNGGLIFFSGLAIFLTFDIICNFNRSSKAYLIFTGVCVLIDVFLAYSSLKKEKEKRG